MAGAVWGHRRWVGADHPPVLPPVGGVDRRTAVLEGNDVVRPAPLGEASLRSAQPSGKSVAIGLAQQHQLTNFPPGVPGGHRHPKLHNLLLRGWLRVGKALGAAGGEGDFRARRSRDEHWGQDA